MRKGQATSSGLWRSDRTRVLIAAAILSSCSAGDPAPFPDDADRQSANERAELPEFYTIDAAPEAEWTPASPEDVARDFKWERSQGNAANTRFSPLAQIDLGNVAQLEVAWIYRAGDGGGNIQANPVVAGGMIYMPTPGKDIVAIDAVTGKERWRFKPPFDHPEQHLYGPAQRGLLYAETARGARLFFMGNGYLFALDPLTGQPIDSFGAGGKVASRKGAGASAFLGAVAPAIAGNVLVAANRSLIEAYDAVTGKPLWQFDARTYNALDPKADNGANIWGGIAVDVARRIVFAAVGDPHPNFLGIGRPGRNNYSNSLIALDIHSGKLLWSFQDIAHNIWDLDLPAPPNLVTVTRNGRSYAAIAQLTKQGNTFVLDRRTGRSLFPIRMRRAPVSKIPGEYTWPYQPSVELPEPFSSQIFTREHLTNIDAASRAEALARFEKANHGWFEPFEPGKPTIFYGVRGGAEWTGGSFDPTTGWLYVSANHIANEITVLKATAEEQLALLNSNSPGFRIFKANCSSCHGENRQGKGMVPPLVGLKTRRTLDQVLTLLKTGRGAMPAFRLTEIDKTALVNFLFDKDAKRADAMREYIRRLPRNAPERSYATGGFVQFKDAAGYPLSRPPWGTLNAINLNTGRIEWKAPLGEYPELTARGIPQTGMENFGGAMATAGGLVFVAGTSDLMFRAFDKRTGREVWKHKLPFGGYAPPASYQAIGRQYVVIAATGGGKLGTAGGDAYVAFALPSSRSPSSRAGGGKPARPSEGDAR